MGIGEELERLAQLRQDGHLDDGEFSAAKAKLLGGDPEGRLDVPRHSVPAAASASRQPPRDLPPVARTSGSASRFAVWALVAAGLFGVLFVSGSSAAPPWCNSLQEFVRADMAALAREGTECLARAESYRPGMAILGAAVVGLAAATVVVHRRERASWSAASGSAMAVAVAVAIGVVALFSMVGAGKEAVLARYSPGEDYADSEGGGVQPAHQAPRQETWQERRQREAIECDAAGPDYRFVVDTGQCIFDPF